MALDRDEHARRVAERIGKLEQSVGFHETCGFRSLSWGDGKARTEMVVAPSVQNISGNLHGGATASLVDHVGTLAIITADQEARPGVTTDLNVTYFAPAPAGSTVIADAQVLKCGKTMAYVTVDVRRAHDGVLIAQGRMTKYQAV
jgi:acyl-coenzyme A thioesterase 13